MTWFGENQDTRLDGNETVKGCLQVNLPEHAASIADWPSGLRLDAVASQGASVSSPVKWGEHNPSPNMCGPLTGLPAPPAHASWRRRGTHRASTPEGLP